MKRINSSFQCCIEDGSRSAAYIIQLRCANHLKVLCSKGMVLNVQAKGSVRHYQVRVKKLNANEPLKKCRKGKLVGKTVGLIALAGQTVTGNCLLVTDQPALRRQELYTGFYMEREKLLLRCADMPYTLM
jgi:hypothetical protein